MEISSEAIRQVSEELGQRARDWEEEQAGIYNEKPLAVKPALEQPKTWIMEIDGKKVGFQDGTWNEVKVGVIYELDDRVEPYTGRHELLKREILARRCGWQQFVPHFWGAMQRVGIRDGDRRQCTRIIWRKY